MWQGEAWPDREHRADEYWMQYSFFPNAMGFWWIACRA